MAGAGMKFLPVAEVRGTAQAVARLHMAVHEKLGLMAEFIGRRVMDYLKSLTQEVRPPGRNPLTGKWTGPRHAHPGHWADITSVLVNSYSYKVWISPVEVTLELRNSAAYAVYLDLHEGYFVLRGVTDPGGPVVKALQAAIRAIAPTWRLEGV